ncbi:MAG: dTDP-4-dehydrorhamnose 3,5-epimerase family protein [Planctomycetaceae bacterium]|jgi:dTDP-4-dehydrorhamnose 3,5-epimerase|nr:dTDP-4-dehydrorhamnose 3,5-epimerase family protein [Planctomycetaceae bacterium]
MKFTPLLQKGAYQIELEPYGDERGQFTRLFCAKEWQEIGLTKPIVNINHSYTQQKGTIRGLHFQYPPDCEIKIVKCIRGAVWDCVVDVRLDSPTFLKWDAIELTQENNKMILIPEGFAHGFQTLTDNAEMIYFHTNFYAPNNEGGLRFDDPCLQISWLLPPENVSERDRQYQWITSEFKGVTLL